MGALTTQTATSPTTYDTAIAMSQTWNTVIRDSEGRWGCQEQREKTLEKVTLTTMKKITFDKCYTNAFMHLNTL